jgi:hypothetical protein
MAEEKDAAGPRGEGAERVSDRMRALLDEAAEAMRGAGETYLEGRKEEVAKRLAAIAEGLRECARALEGSGNEAIARYADRACARLERAAALLHERHSREFIAETESFARREPALYMLAAVAAGFLGACVLLASSDSLSGAGAAKPEKGGPARASPASPSGTAGMTEAPEGEERDRARRAARGDS